MNSVVHVRQLLVFYVFICVMYYNSVCLSCTSDTILIINKQIAITSSLWSVFKIKYPRKCSIARIRLPTTTKSQKLKKQFEQKLKQYLQVAYV